MTPTRVISPESNEQILFLFNRLTGISPYSHEFVPGFQDPQILSGFVAAMSSFMSEVTGEKQTQWKTVYGSESTLLVEGNEWCIGVLSVARETNEARSKLRKVVLEFEDAFDSLKDADYYEGHMFTDFDHYVRRVFLGDRISYRTRLMKLSDDTEDLRKFDLPSTSFKIRKILYAVKDGHTVNDLSDRLVTNLEDLNDIVSIAVWNHVLQAIFIPNKGDILSLSARASSSVFDPANPLGLSPDTIQVLARMDGRLPYNKIIGEVDVSDRTKMDLQIGHLINQGYVQKITVEKKLLLVSECIVSSLLRTMTQRLGRKQCLKEVMKSYRKTLGKHPWVARLVIDVEGHSKVILDDGMMPRDYDRMNDAIDYLIDTLSGQITQSVGKKYFDSLLQETREWCYQNWSQTIIDTVL